MRLEVNEDKVQLPAPAPHSTLALAAMTVSREDRRQTLLATVGVTFDEMMGMDAATFMEQALECLKTDKGGYQLVSPPLGLRKMAGQGQRQRLRPAHSRKLRLRGGCGKAGDLLDCRRG